MKYKNKMIGKHMIISKNRRKVNYLILDKNGIKIKNKLFEEDDLDQNDLEADLEK